MEEFSAGSALSALGDRSGDGAITKEQLLLGGLTHSAPAAPAQLSRQTSITPGLRYRNLGKSGLRVSNIGLGDCNPRRESAAVPKCRAILVELKNDLCFRDVADVQPQRQRGTGRTNHRLGRGQRHQRVRPIRSTFRYLFSMGEGGSCFIQSVFFAGTRAEVELGRILTRRGWKRTSYIITTKIYWSTR